MSLASEEQWKAKPLDLSRRIPKRIQHKGSCDKRHIRNFLLRFYLGMKQKAVPWNVVDEDYLAVFPCQLVCETNSAEFEVFAIWKRCLQHLFPTLGTKVCDVLESNYWIS